MRACLSIFWGGPTDSITYPGDTGRQGVRRQEEEPRAPGQGEEDGEEAGEAGAQEAEGRAEGDAEGDAVLGRGVGWWWWVGRGC